MKFLRSFNKEQITVAAACALCALMLAGALLGGRVAAVDVVIDAPDRPYSHPPSRFAEFVQDDFLKVYWPGEDIWRPEYTQRLPVPSIKPPEPRPDELAAPLFRPGPAAEAYSKIPSLKVKYPCLAAGAPVIPEAEAPPAAEVEAVKKLEEPAVKPKADKRAEREREFFTLELASGTKVEGTFIDEDAVYIWIRDRKDGQAKKYPKGDRIKRVLPNWTNEERYQRESRAVKPGPQEAQERLKLALWCCDEVGMVQEAEAEAKRVIEHKKESLEGYLLLGRIYVDQGNYDGAMAAYEAGIAAGAPAPDLCYEIGRCCRALSPMEEPWLEAARAAFERALEASPRHQKSKVALARTLLDLGQPKAAADMAGDFFTKLGGVLDTKVPEKVEGYLVRGVAMLRMGEVEKARADLAEALKLLGPHLEALKAAPAEATPPKPPAIPEWQAAEALKAAEAQNAEGLNALAVLDALEGKYAQAGAGFLNVVKANPYAIDAWTNLGALLLLAGKWADAEAIYAAAAQRDPISAEALLGIGLAQAMGGKPDGAASIEKALKVDPRHAGARAVLGHLKLRAAGMDEAALELYKEALRYDYSYMPAYYGATIAFLRAAQKARAEAEVAKDDDVSRELSQKAREFRMNAETLLQKLRVFDPGRADTLVALGCVYALLDRPEDAMESLHAAARILQQKSDPLLHYALGYVEYWFPVTDPDEKRLEKALGSFMRCVNVEVNPQDPFGAEVVKETRKIIEDIQDWKVTSLRLDDRFEREPGPVIGLGWLELENYGVTLDLAAVPGVGGRCRSSGQQAKADMGITVLERQIPSENFYAMELTFFPEKVQGAEYGVSIYTSQQGNTRVGFHVGFNDKGKALYNSNLSYPNDMDMKDMVIVRWSEIKTPLPNPAEIRLRIVRGEKERRPFWNIFWWDPAKLEWALAQKEVPANLGGGAGQRQWTVSMWTRAPRGQQVSLDLDNVRIYERTRK